MYLNGGQCNTSKHIHKQFFSKIVQPCQWLSANSTNKHQWQCGSEFLQNLHTLVHIFNKITKKKIIKRVFIFTFYLPKTHIGYNDCINMQYDEIYLNHTDQSVVQCQQILKFRIIFLLHTFWYDVLKRRICFFNKRRLFVYWLLFSKNLPQIVDIKN